MTGLSILLLLTCGVVLSQGIPYSSGNSNVNSNVNSFRRNYNGNSNSNTVYPRYPRYMYKDEDEGDQGGDKIHDDVYGEISTNDVDLAVAAADATLAITKSLADDMSQTASVAVGDAVGRIVTDRRRRRSSRRSYNSRRNINSNSNTNIVGQPHPEIRDPGFYQNEDESYPSSGLFELERGLRPILGEFSDTREMDYDNEGDEASNLWAAVPRIGSGAAAIAFGPSGRAGSRAHMFNDNEDEEDEEEEVDEGDEKNKDEQSPGYVNHMPTGSRAWHRQNRRNYNANSNSNRIGGYRRNFNSNANSNVFRRNMNSNSNTNSFRRSNLNNNSNDNRIGRLRFYPRK